MIPEFHGKIKDGLYYYNNFKVFLLYTKGLKDGDYYLELHKVKGSPKTPEQLGYFHAVVVPTACLLYTSPSPRDRQRSRMPSSA